ncbi:engulfment and cell motility protein 2-like isoform X2 [Cylas formicarius]|uniref:engulfment and cell motility protein 2-like isoform X2 n=1 Tax=Cylas formicarius TaxID=197179 RepID=UPI002958A962|nr:engulfment and cell motility protein 2-like isoform X2 [Cylas formicarius]
MTEVAKISVEKFDSKEQILFVVDKALGLFENVKLICRKTGLPESHVYGLKFLPTKDNPLATHYISETNFGTIKHNDCLKVVFSIKYMTQRIVNNLHDENVRPICFKDLSRLCLDPIFIEELVEEGKHKSLIEEFTDAILESEEQLPLLVTVVHLFQKGHIEDTSQNILQKTLNVLKCSDTTAEEAKYCLSLLQKVLISKNTAFDQWKIKIIREVPITEIVPYIWSEDNGDLQYSALLLINTIIKCCKGDKKVALIKEMNLRKNRENVYKHIILKGDLERNMEHELYVLQTYIFSLLTEALQTEIALNDNQVFNKDEFELCTEDIRRITILMDFDEENFQNHNRYSVDSLFLNNTSDSRLSLASFATDEGSKSSHRSSRKINEIIDYENFSINQLTLDALRHYKKYHYNNFHQSQIEEKLYEPGIFVTSERIVKILAKILHVGMDQPDAKSTSYQPAVFNCSPRTPFFLELFSRTMWLLSKTRREMKASTITDYPKVMKILEKQLKMALKNKPKDFKDLTNMLSNTSFKTVVEQVQRDKEQEFKTLQQHNPCVIELKERLTLQNRTFVDQNRIRCLLVGAHFPKVLEKKTSGNIFVQLCRNEKELAVYNMSDVKTNKMDFQEKHKIEDITHVVVGKNCKHANLCGNRPGLAFSVIVNHEEKIKFIAKDERTACHWVDALNILAGNTENLSKYYAEELNELVQMDLRLQLMDLQNVIIPKTPPPVPPVPEDPRPTLAPKPRVKKQRSRIL